MEVWDTRDTMIFIIREYSRVATIGRAKISIADSWIVVESLSLNPRLHPLKCMLNGEPYEEQLYRYSQQSDLPGTRVAL